MNIFNSVKNKVNTLLQGGAKVHIIKDKKYKEEKLLAEGGFGYVYLVTDESNKQYALKLQHIQDHHQSENIRRELIIWTNINNHTNIIQLIDYEVSSTLALILMEFSKEGSLFNYINDNIDKNLNESTCLGIFKEILNGVIHMHCKSTPAIAHRDIKIENVLRCGNTWKLCDFGSASTETLNPKTADKRYKQDQFSKYDRTTTFMYRPPEMIDEYCNFVVDEKVDIWMLGCLLFALLYKKHPFFEVQKGSIINADYHFPDTSEYSDKICDFIRLMLTQNPKSRPNSSDILKIIMQWNSIKEIPLPKETQEIKRRQIEHSKMNTNVKGAILTPEKMAEIQAQIIKDQKKGNKYSKYNYNNNNNDDTGDINDMFDDMDDIYNTGISSNKENNCNGNSNSNSKGNNGNSNNNSNKEKEKESRYVDSLFNTNVSNNIEKTNNSNTNKNDEWGIDFNTGFVANHTNKSK